MRSRGERKRGAQALARDWYHLARLNVAYVLGVNQIERARLGGEDPRVAESAQGERAESARVANGDERVRRQKQHRERAFGLAESFGDGLLDSLRARARDAVQDDFRI